jgi:rubrerythrin
MQPQTNATSALQAPVEGLVRTRYTLLVCVVCGHERIHTPLQETSCPECGARARRSFALFRDLREEQR